ncbi:hypothetical protein Salmuc_01831 [Salipiger mucosus DSM 16094]|uniref:Uncharacterized protein n=1 Tax=Salipiger mucosus DSM 16094 TaxID=1123237 RepID=S9QRP3_9RHOB|nr:hypothetical protein Salmuc_01831 [Salipiger mucosus DSM 16094]
MLLLKEVWRNIQEVVQKSLSILAWIEEVDVLDPPVRQLYEAFAFLENDRAGIPLFLRENPERGLTVLPRQFWPSGQGIDEEFLQVRVTTFFGEHLRAATTYFDNFPGHAY